MERPITVYMIGNAHIDPVWLWTMAEGRKEVLSTYRTAIALIQRYDGYIFTSGGAVTFRWVEEDDPALFAAIQRAVAEGRWALVNGWWLQPDCNIPHGESFARHALYGQRYLEAHFGKRARVGYNVDSFGHAGTLPQLLKLGGLEYYVFFRPGPHEKELPRGPFWWEAPGGERVLACRPPLHYCSPEDEDVLERVAAAAREAPPDLPFVMCFYGVGNHGGGPTRRHVEALQQAMTKKGPWQPRFASPEEYFRQVTELARSWPIVREELQHHSRGCYTALSRVKRENRYTEHALMQAERFAALATALCGAAKAQKRLQGAWEGVLFNQFHDILAGTSVRKAYEDVWEFYRRARRVAQEVQEEALETLGARVRVPEGPGQPLLVWNPLPWAREEVVHFALPMGSWRDDPKGERYPDTPEIYDAQGQRLPCQLVGVEFDWSTYLAHIEARVRVPGLGVRLLYIKLKACAPPNAEPPQPFAETMENAFYRLQVDPQTGWIVSLWDKIHNVELLAGPAGVPLVLDDPSDTWSHDVDAFRQVVGRFSASEPPKLVQKGPIRQTLQVVGRWGSSRIVQEIGLYEDMPYIDLALTIDWHEQHKMLKLAFPLNLWQGKVVAEAPYGVVSREANGEEEPCQSWVDLSGELEGKQWGLCLVNDSKYGYDALGGELRLSLLRSPIYAFHRPRRVIPGVEYPYIDQGRQRVRCRLLPHWGPWQEAHLARRGYEFLEPLIPRSAEPHEGPWPEGALFEIAPEQMVGTVLKISEEGERLLLRGYEATGQPGELYVRIPVLRRSWHIQVEGHQVWTVGLPLGVGTPRLLNFLEEPLGA
ncbi:MAG: alpha-mannosidase [Anaerolineae bacterium]|nr:alpha-mannosidase [Anaerolineae bacterium]